MIKSIIDVNLPSTETERNKTLGEWVTSLFGKEHDLRSGQEEVNATGLALVLRMAEAFDRAGVHDAISLLVDHEAIYMDASEVEYDLDVLKEVATARVKEGKPFEEIHLVMTHREHGLHTLIDTRIRSRTLLGQDEMRVEVVSRIDELLIRAGESAEAYRQRVVDYAGDDSRMGQMLQASGLLARQLAEAITETMQGAVVKRGEARVTVIRPQKEQVGRFRDLKFGEAVDKPGYRPCPTHHRHGAYADPFFYYYYDPYYDLTSYILVDAIFDGLWHSSHVHVVDPYGNEVGTGADLNTQDKSAWDAADTVAFDATAGGVDVDGSIPITDAADPIEQFGGSDVEGGFGGSDVSDGGFGGSDVSDSDSSSGGGFFSDFFSGGGSDDSSGSSCGSSCGSSSCGSSCGGGCGGD